MLICFRGRIACFHPLGCSKRLDGSPFSSKDEWLCMVVGHISFLDRTKKMTETPRCTCRLHLSIVWVLISPFVASCYLQHPIFLLKWVFYMYLGRRKICSNVKWNGNDMTSSSVTDEKSQAPNKLIGLCISMHTNDILLARSFTQRKLLPNVFTGVHPVIIKLIFLISHFYHVFSVYKLSSFVN